MTLCLDQSARGYPALADMVVGQRGKLPNLHVFSMDRKLLHLEEKYGRNTGLMAYFRAGMQTSDAVRQLIAWHFGPDFKINRLLDFASGCGHLTRFLVQDFGPECVWAADIRPEAIQFQKEQLNIQTLVSTAKPENFKPGLQFDCIFAGSLFRHLTEISFTRWLWKMYSLLTPGGLLIFSVHGEAAVPAGVTMPRSGFYFVPSCESDLPNASEYGTAVVLDSFVQSAIQAVTGLPTHKRIPQALNFSEDIYVIAKGKLKDGEIPFQFGPIGCVDFGRWTDPNRLKLSGWAFDVTRGERVTEVLVYYNGRLRGRTGVALYRPDVAAVLGCSGLAEAVQSGWECIVELAGESGYSGTDPEIDPEQDWLMVKTISSSGRQFVMLLDRPATLKEFEAPQGWTYSASGQPSQPITAAVRYIYLPHMGRFTSANPELSGWIATKDRSALEGVSLQGRFGDIPFLAVDRPDVEAAMPNFAALGFQAWLPREYFTVADPQLRFVTRNGSILSALETAVEPQARVTEPTAMRHAFAESSVG